MSNLNQSSSINSTSTLYMSSEIEEQIFQDVRSTTYVADTMSSAAEAQGKNGSQATNLDLPPPSTNVGYAACLTRLTDALGAVYTSMSAETEDQVTQLTQLQQTDQMMCLLVVNSTSKMIQKQKVQFHKEDKIQAEVQKQQREEKHESIFSYVLGGILLAITLASALVTMGASLAAAPEEIAGEAGEQAGENAAEKVVEQGGEEGANGENGSGNGVDGPNGAGNSAQAGEQNIENISGDQNAQGESDCNNQAKDNCAKEETTYEKMQRLLNDTWFKRGVGIGGSLALGIPQIVEGLSNVAIGKSQELYAKVQKNVGAATATLSKNSAYLQYYQQLVGRGSTVCQQLASQLGGIIETAGNIMSNFSQMSQGLAQAHRS